VSELAWECAMVGLHRYKAGVLWGLSLNRVILNCYNVHVHKTCLLLGMVCGYYGIEGRYSSLDGCSVEYSTLQCGGLCGTSFTPVYTVTIHATTRS
jgi:hypothetical protein